MPDAVVVRIVVVVGSEVVVVLVSFPFAKFVLGRNTNKVVRVILNFFCFMTFLHETYCEYSHGGNRLYGMAVFLFKKEI